MAYYFKTKYIDEAGHARIGRYVNGETAIELYSAIGELLSKPTTNLEAYGMHPAPGNVFVRDDDQYEGWVTCLQGQGIIGPTIRIIEFGYRGEAHECALLIAEDQ